MINLAFPDGTITAIQSKHLHISDLHSFIEEKKLAKPHQYILFYRGEEFRPNGFIPKSVFKSSEPISLIPLDLASEYYNFKCHHSFKIERFSQYFQIEEQPKIEIISNKTKTTYNKNSQTETWFNETIQSESDSFSEQYSENDILFFDDFESTDDFDENQIELQSREQAPNFPIMNTENVVQRLDSHNWLVTTNTPFCLTNHTDLLPKDSQSIV